MARLLSTRMITSWHLPCLSAATPAPTRAPRVRGRRAIAASRSGSLRRCLVGPIAGRGEHSGGADDVTDDDDRRRTEALLRDDRGERVEPTDRVPLPGQAGVLDDRDR